jgi:ADP-ribose pyrophosphatase
LSAKILSRQETYLSPWVRLVRKEVEFAHGQQVEIYHSLSQVDYIAILAQTPDDLIPIVRQYRPAVEAYTWELPAGLLEPGEDPEQTCRRELREETGLEAKSVTYLGAYYADTGRLENRLHAFYVQASEPDLNFVPEPGMSVEYVTLEALKSRIRLGKFRHQLHVAILLLHELYLTDQQQTAQPS